VIIGKLANKRRYRNSMKGYHARGFVVIIGEVKKIKNLVNGDQSRDLLDTHADEHISHIVTNLSSIADTFHMK
jgi:hypothetical protein